MQGCTFSSKSEEIKHLGIIISNLWLELHATINRTQVIFYRAITTTYFIFSIDNKIKFSGSNDLKLDIELYNSHRYIIVDNNLLIYCIGCSNLMLVYNNHCANIVI